MDYQAKSNLHEVKDVKKSWSKLNSNNFELGGKSANVVLSVNSILLKSASQEAFKDARPKLDKKLLGDIRATHWGAPDRSNNGSGFVT